MTLTAVVIGAVVVLGGGFWYYNHQTSRSNKAWADLNPTDIDGGTTVLIERFKSVAHEDISPELTRTAWLSVGNAALSELGGARPSAEATEDSEVEPPDRDQLIATAKEAFEKVINQGSDDLTACGRAMLAMGVLEENQHQFDKARQWYSKVIDDARFENMPFRKEAKFRLDGMPNWSHPIEFPPPPPPVTISTGDAKTPPEKKTSNEKPDAVPGIPDILSNKRPVAAPPMVETKAESPPSIPTTQPTEPSDANPGTEP